MASKYVKEEFRKNRYTTRACSYFIKRITAPMDDNPVEYKSIRRMSEELQLNDAAIRKFVKSGMESMYIRSKQTNVLYLLLKPQKKLAAKARLADIGTDAPPEQTFTSLYQLSKRFNVSSNTVFALKRETPLGEESARTIRDEFGRRYYITFYGEE